MKFNIFSPWLLLLFFLFQSCSENEDTAEVDLNAVAFSADSHVETSTLAQTILDYISANYAGLTIVEAEIEDNQNFEIELSDGTELIFNSQGEFLGVDNDENDFDDEDIDPSELPQNILQFISDNFPGVDIDEAELENNGNYEIELENEIELIFDGNGNFLGQAQDENDEGEDEEDIDPSELPQVILDYIAQNYPDNTIIEAEVDEEEYEVTLNNGVELEFDLEGNLLSVEDGNGDDDDDNDDD